MHQEAGLEAVIFDIDPPLASAVLLQLFLGECTIAERLGQEWGLSFQVLSSALWAFCASTRRGFALLPADDTLGSLCGLLLPLTCLDPPLVQRFRWKLRDS